MDVQIFNHAGNKQYVNWVANETMGLKFTSEMPGGMISASFDVPEEYRLPFNWADVFNQIKIYHGPTEVWSGLGYAVERYWGDESGIRVDCVGNVARLGMWTLNTNLSNEKASTYITDHVLTHPEFVAFMSSDIDTTDYTIPGMREYPRNYIRDILDDLYSFNQDTHNWYVEGATLYWEPVETALSYITSTEFCEGSLRQELSEFSNYLRYTYRDMDGLVTNGAVTDTDTEYPATVVIDNYSDNMTAAQALVLAEASLENHKVLGATAEITISKVWKAGGGEIHPSELKPGKIIRIEGLIPAKASPSEAFIDNDIDTFVIKSVTYNHDSQTASVSPGRLPYTLSKAIARK